jgi:hypothetical protein
MMLTLEKWLGEETMGRVMRTYFGRWKFHHPTTKDFVQVAEEVSGQDLGWFFSQVLYSPDKLDYGISDLSAREITEPKGIFDGKLQAPKTAEARPKLNKLPTKTYRNEVIVARYGEWIFSQEIMVVFEDGKKIREAWDGKDRWKRFVYIGTSKVLSATVDPERKILLDVNWTNNSKTLKPEKAGILKFALALTACFQGFLSLASW